MRERHLRGRAAVRRVQAPIPSFAQLIDAFLGDLAVAPFDGEAADCFGRVAAALAEKGVSIRSLDAMIAAHALRLGLTVVTHNVAHFRRVRGLKVVDWL